MNDAIKTTCLHLGMKWRNTMKKLLQTTLSLLLVVALSQTASAQKFHDEGALKCSGCHTIHYSEEGADPAGAAAGGPFKHLLKDDSTTDLCLSCHDAAGSQATFAWAGSTPPKIMGAVTNDLPGGNFTGPAVTAGKGHSLDTTAFAAANLASSPGGAFSSTGFSCADCHDPHGSNSASFEYRNLLKTVNGVTLTAAEIAGADAEEATLVTAGAAADQNADAFAAGNHNVYKGEMGKWCGACHSNPDNAGTGFHGTVVTDSDVGDNTDWIRHPTGTALTGPFATNYGANYNPSYPMVTTAAGATTASNWAIVAAESKVFCLSCHAAHGTDNTDMLRWDYSVSQAAATGCNKCHGK
jgi:predicted CXXCH cytochrome family protein